MAVYKSFIKRALSTALKEFMEKDIYLLHENLNERSITHKVAEYLQREFGAFYNVDCEYNRNFLTPGVSKKINVVQDLYKEIEDLVETKTKLEILTNYEYRELTVYPDIIVHKRGKGKNLLAVEVKKSNSRIHHNFDFRKLSAYTDHSEMNYLHYEYGVFICFDVDNYSFPSITWFKDGHRVNDI